MSNTLFGRFPSGDVWAPGVELSTSSVGVSVVIDYDTDNALSVQFTDPEDARKGVIIPRGRFVGFGSRSVANTLVSSGKPTLTLADGKNIAPIGLAVQNIFRNTDKNMVGVGKAIVRKGIYARVPYIHAVNGAAGTLNSGDLVTAHFGSTTSASVIEAEDKGQVVKFTPRGLNYVAQSAGTAMNLAFATNPGIIPTLLFAENAGTKYSGAAPTLAFDGAKWVATFASNVTHGVWQYGQTDEMIAGRVMDVQNLVDLQNQDSLVKFVESEGGQPLAYRRRKMLQTGQTVGTAENPTSLGSGRYRVANQLVPNYSVKVWIQGTVTFKDGVQETYSSSDWYQLPILSNNSRYKNDLFGEFHTVNWKTRIIELTDNITVTAIRVAYTYEAAPEVAWGNGIQDLTDGGNLTPGAEVSSVQVVPDEPAGLPAYVNYSDVVGVIRFWVN